MPLLRAKFRSQRGFDEQDKIFNPKNNHNNCRNSSIVKLFSVNDLLKTKNNLLNISPVI